MTPAFDLVAVSRAVQDRHKPSLNFLLIGQVRSGAGAVQSVLDADPRCVCHTDLLHAEEERRRQGYERYFGPVDPTEWPPRYFCPAEESPGRFLSDTAFTRRLHGEDVVGARVSYDDLQRHQLYDFLDDSYRDGGFCVIHVLRNPVMCLVSLRQAERTGRWESSINEGSPPPAPPAVGLTAEEVLEFTRGHESALRRVRAACPDSLEIQYEHLVTQSGEVWRRLYEFLELRQEVIPTPRRQRLRNRPPRDRIYNYARLIKELPGAVVRDYFGEGLQ